MGTGTVVVPLSGAFSESAVGPAQELARRLAADLYLLGVGIDADEAEEMDRRLRLLAEPLGASVETRIDWDVPGCILEVANEHSPALVCMATHAKGRLGGTISYATGVLAKTTRPVMLVGPALEPDRAMAGPVLACVDGSPMSETVLPAAAAWAAALSLPLRVVTVTGPIGAPTSDHERLVHDDPDGYLERLAHQWGEGVEVSWRSIYDPDGAAAGLARHLKGADGGLVAVTTHARSGLRRVVLGSTTASIVRSSPIPVLVVPPPAG